MADLIQLLPDAIANQIAAGEVVQRPASAVKELMENAVDAGATEIRLIVKDAGKTLVQVTDNGCGMSETDARMCFERHATSKIRQSSDLFAIRTMGFRGEALASIAAVAQVEMRSRRPEDELGTRILIEGSELKAQEPCQTAPGTSISMRNLFYNVPARRNFLKSNVVEMRHIIDEFQRVAIANPEVFFSLHHNNEELFHLPASNLRQRLVGIFGIAYNKRLVPVKEDTDILNIDGFVGKPEFARKTRGEQMFFINGRFIKSGYLHHAVMTAYEDILPAESFPFYVLCLEIDPARIDVNVHPTKQEIKFDDERLVYNYLRVAVRHALGSHSITPSLDFDQDITLQQAPTAPRQESYTIKTIPSSFSPPSTAHRTPPTADRIPHTADRIPPNDNLRHWEKLYEGLDELAPAQPETLIIESGWNADAPMDDTAGTFSKKQKDPYQIHGTYIVSHIKSGFLLIDQQAAHERILYEQYLRVLGEQAASVQHQLFPRTVALPPADAVLLREIRPQVNLLGFDIQEFGQNTFVINGLPAEMAGKKDELAILETLLEQFRQNNELQLDVRDNLARSMARSAAIRRGAPLTVPEMQSLIDRLFACEMPYKSPAGRQCFVTFELEDLARR
ncbi:MAG TPA: DNA mismatch repair endonuclease MutL, partial [Saprospiraceae bacterium]|nr:DNA mismatch repair endonuclease MutL [Saprospiraceae bacterium]